MKVTDEGARVVTFCHGEQRGQGADILCEFLHWNAQGWYELDGTEAVKGLRIWVAM